jgi:hypothetical protein
MLSFSATAFKVGEWRRELSVLARRVGAGGEDWIVGTIIFEDGE